MSCKILSIGAKEGKTPLVIITALADEKKQRYVITEGTYREIGCPLSGEEINEENLYTLVLEDEKRRALQKSLNILGFADNNKRALCQKLLRAGFRREAVDFALTECVMRGYIDEERQAERLVLKYAAEFLGPHKIIAKLSAKYYSPSLISKTIRSLEARGEIDFNKNKKELLSLKLGSDSGYEEKMKLLYKYGYLK